jgi:type I restriction enzyme S subunit
MALDDGHIDGWSTRRLDEVAELKRGLSWSVKQERNSASETSVPVLRIPNIQERLDLSDVLYLEGIGADDRTKCAVSRGWNLIVASNGNPERVGNCVFIDRDMEFVFASFLVGLGSKDASLLHPEFLARLLLSEQMQRAISRNVQGSTGLSNINLSQLMRSRIELPPIVEQIGIAELLGAVDYAIDATRRVIEQTRRLKTAVLQDLLTRGLPGRHSEFREHRQLGSYPADWKLCRLDQIARVERGKFTHRPRNDPAFYGGPTPFVQTSDVVNSGDYLRQHSQTLNARGLAVSRVFPKGTILFVIAGTVGEPTIASYDVAFPDSVVGITPRDGVNSFFLLRLLQFGHRRVVRTATESAQANISLELLRPLPFALPEPDEQAEIGRILRAVEERVEHEIESLDRLRLVKSALSQALLTGRVRCGRLHHA